MRGAGAGGTPGPAVPPQRAAALASSTAHAGPKRPGTGPTPQRGPAVQRFDDSDSDIAYPQRRGPGGQARRNVGNATVAAIVAEDDRSLSPTPSDVSSSSHTPSPLGSEAAGGDADAEAVAGAVGRKRKYVDEDTSMTNAGDTSGGPGGSPTDAAARYARMILDYFISESNQIPAFLINPPIDFDPNVVIDDDGHTALHWACAMGRIRIVKLLLTAGADIFRANAMGQTALMRSVMFTNNYDLRKFPELFELLHRSTINIDRLDRTVFHYTVDIALSKGKVHAARYYMETVLSRLADYPREIADILNWQDEDGDTALTLAARARSKRLVKLLLDNGGDPKVANKDAKSAEDYILEDERFRAASLGPQGGTPIVGGPGGIVAAPTGLVDGMAGIVAAATAPTGGLVGWTPTLHYSETAQRAANQAIPQMAEMLESLASSFDAELEDKERDLSQAQSLLVNIQAEIVEGQRTLHGLQQLADGLEPTKARQAELEEELKAKMGKRYRFGWEKYVRDEEEREKAYREAKKAVAEAGGEAQVDAATKEAAQTQLDLDALMASPPSDIGTSNGALRQRLQTLRNQRSDLFSSFVHLQSETGASGLMAEYRRLIGMGTGVGPGEVEAVIRSLAESLDQDEPEGMALFGAGAAGAAGGANGIEAAPVGVAVA